MIFNAGLTHLGSKASIYNALDVWKNNWIFVISMSDFLSGVSQGSWYYECKIKDQPEGSHTRLGWCQQLANLQAPLGYDKFGYSWRSR